MPTRTARSPEAKQLPTNHAQSSGHGAASSSISSRTRRASAMSLGSRAAASASRRSALLARRRSAASCRASRIASESLWPSFRRMARSASAPGSSRACTVRAMPRIVRRSVLRRQWVPGAAADGDGRGRRDDQRERSAGEQRGRRVIAGRAGARAGCRRVGRGCVAQTVEHDAAVKPRPVGPDAELADEALCPRTARGRRERRIQSRAALGARRRRADRGGCQDGGHEPEHRAHARRQ